MVGMVCSCDCYIIWTKALLYLHITPTGAAMKLPVFVSSVCDDVNARGSLELCSNEISIVLAACSALTLWFSTFLSYSSLKKTNTFP